MKRRKGNNVFASFAFAVSYHFTHTTYYIHLHASPPPALRMRPLHAITVVGVVGDLRVVCGSEEGGLCRYNNITMLKKHIPKENIFKEELLDS
jgi:hypothetical protein